MITVNGRRFEHTDCDGEMGAETLGPGDSVVCATTAAQKETAVGHEQPAYKNSFS